VLADLLEVAVLVHQEPGFRAISEALDDLDADLERREGV
jgi:hypothetical protein